MPKKLKAQDRYNRKMPVICVRVSEEECKKIDRVVKGRAKWFSGFNRQRYLYELITNDLETLKL